MNLRRALPIVLAATTLMLSGCGGDDEGSGNDGSLNATFATVFMEQQLTEDPDEASCAADGIISAIGEDRLAELGLTAGNIGELSAYAFTEEEQAIMLGQLFDCIDISVSLRQEYLDSGLTEEQAACVVEQLDVDALKELASTGPEGGAAAGAAQAEAEVGAFAECGVEG